MANIPDEVIDQVSAALNAAIGITLVHAKEMNKQMLDASLALDEAINEADDDEE